MANLPRTAPTTEISRPLYIVHKRPGDFRDSSVLSISVHRMDGLPAFDSRGERLRSDRENWLSLPEALEALRDMMQELPQYGTVTRIDEETAENLRRFNEEFGYEVLPSNRIEG